MAFRWVILGAGDIAVKFNDAVRRVDGCEVIGVGSRSAQRGAEFAQKHGIPASGSYEEMLTLRPDAAYIAARTDAHAALTRLCIEHGIPVLCEKAMFTNSAEAEEIFALAEEKGVFAMEAMWSRFLPALVEMKHQLDAGAIGDVKFGEFNIGWRAYNGPGSRFYEPDLGGGAAYDLLVYCYELAEFFLGEPEEVAGVFVNWAPTGVDETETIVLRYPFGHVTLCASIGAWLTERIALNGSKGAFFVPKPHFTNEFTHRALDGAETRWHDDVTENGFVYQVQEVVRCVREGLLESPTVPHALTIRCAKVFDQINATKEKQS